MLRYYSYSNCYYFMKNMFKNIYVFIGTFQSMLIMKMQNNIYTIYIGCISFYVKIKD
jgi:hypothetical protein